MNIAFEKYHGTGNDFIMIDIRNHAMQLSTDIIAYLCDSKFGIGADGLISLDNSDNYDFSMRYYNSDGNESSMCGNGGRCITAFASQLGIIKQNARFMAPDGPHLASILSISGSEYEVSLQMNDVKASNWEEKGIFLDTGSPHFVKICTDLDNLDVYTEGSSIRNENRFSPDGTNVNFIEGEGESLNIRTYERGVEEETLSCGTGITAAAIAWAIRHNLDEPINVNALGGELLVSFRRVGDTFKDIRLEGPAEHVFSGNIEIEFP